MTRDDTKLLQAIVSGQKGLEDRLTGRLDKMDKKLDGIVDRLDKQGAQLAYLEDDAPTVKEFNRLKKRVAKLESRLYN